jgi:hypothetical protein
MLLVLTTFLGVQGSRIVLSAVHKVFVSSSSDKTQKRREFRSTKILFMHERSWAQCNQNDVKREKDYRRISMHVSVPKRALK